MPWRTRKCSSATSRRERLQFGHGFDAVEDDPQTKKAPADLPCFNSATALMPWRTFPDWIIGRFGIMLQFGHGFDAVEDQFFAELLGRQLGASIRPRL